MTCRSNSVKWAVEQGITKGTTTTTFPPNSTCTTAQILVMLYRAAGEPEVLIANPFTDVPENAYYRSIRIRAPDRHVHEQGSNIHKPTH